VTRETNLAELTDRLLTLPVGARSIVAIIGAPGSGKSTLADALVRGVNNATPNRAALLPMDGYHFDDILLTSLGRQARKGAPDTFDVDGLRHMLARLRENDADCVAIPVFDRTIEIARAGAALIQRTSDIIVVEGTYLLLEQQPWKGLAPLFDLTVMIKTSPQTLRDRLMLRWENAGIRPTEARRKVEENDLPNGDFAMKNSMATDFMIET